MAYYEDIDLFLTSDRNHADVFNEPLEKIIQNIEDTRRMIKDATDYLDTLEKTFADYTKTEDLNDLLATGIKGEKGDKGTGLEFDWDNTKLGVKREDETEYQYVDLKGDAGSIEDIDKILDKKTINYVNIKDYGAIGDGATDCSDFINNAITYAKENKRGGIYIPTGVYIIDKPIMLYDDVNVYGDGSSSILKQKDNTEIEAVMIVNSSYGDQPNYSTRLENYNITLKDFRIDGNRQNNTTYNDSAFTNNNGIILKGTHYSFISRVTIENCGRDGFVLTDNGTGDWNGHCSTNEFIQVNILRSGRYNLFIDEFANDNVFTNCNFGNSLIDNMNIVGGSNTFFSCIIWGANCRGVTIGAQQNSFRGCNIEGNGHYGIYFAEYGHHSCISNCKFMANGKEEYNEYSHVYLGGHADTICKDIIISDCIFMGSSEFADGSGLTKACIEMNEYHEGVNLSNNSIYYNSQGTKFELEKQHVLGLKEKDILNGIIIINSKNRPTRDNTPLGAIYIEEDTGKMVYYDVVNYEWITLDTVPTSLPANGGNADTVNNQSFTWEFGNGNPTHIWGRANGEETNKVFSPSQITVGTASKLEHTLTLTAGGHEAGSFNGTADTTIALPLATADNFGLMSASMVQKLNAIEYEANKTIVMDSLGSTSTTYALSANQGRLLNNSISSLTTEVNNLHSSLTTEVNNLQEQIKNQLQNAGDYMGKTMIAVPTTKIYPSYTYTNAKGGFADFMFWTGDDGYDSFDLTVDGVTVTSDAEPARILKRIDNNNYYTFYELKIPFKNTFTVSHYGSGDDNSYIHGFLYVNN